MTDTLVNLSNPEKLFIGGDWAASSDGGGIEIVSPSTEEVVGRVGKATKADMDRVVAIARQAFDHGPWPRTTGSERAKVLRRIAEEMTKRADDFARAWSLQVGMPYAQSSMTAPYMAAYFTYFADLAEQGFEEVRKPMLGGHCIVVREPAGVVVAVVPWNAPLATLLLKVAPALAAGCVVIAKPSPETPLEALILAECIAAAGVPEGVFSVVTADREVSDHLIRNADVDKVSFTGSTAAGLHIASVCGGRMARVTTELGGKSAAIILDDADIGAVVAGIMPNLVGLCGQQCAAFSRILVSAARKAEVTEAVAAAMRAVTVGDPFDQATQMGPLVTRSQHGRVFGYIEKGKAEGARLVTGGGRPTHLARGWFVEPTLFADASNDMVIAREEIFGPVGTVIAYDSEEQAVAIANDSNYGLSGGVFTQDPDRAYAMARRIRTGNFGHNGRVIDFTMPYGGFKQSGIGREGGVEGLHAFTEVKAVFMPELPSHLRS
ncbi:aldehyde dehydrogenase [Rhizorhabdus dicambivorans]|uniref:aldehyde dehydrogenase (NAD(+)) n=1 Tax=Rhizorhabdus dicambivorans TaxID=1850238 RepID=A0A2A4FR47_9SPHN|nr:aldehyde dehydrogenase [Rhizorhabdus dicambivorans]ATE63982.1 aldehyde dehydrogenase [Rhizorhabdus dicambivorans]PCE40182.1 aldehyde dehydrogenase [Rhizorhabdus dicambivorans]